MARVYDEAGRLEAAMETYEKALSFYSKQRSLRHRSGVASTLTTMGTINVRKKEYDVAMACFDEALTILQALEVDGNRGEQIGEIYQWQGNVLRETGDCQSALALYTEAFYTTTLKYGKMHPRLGRIHQSMAIIYDDLGDFDESLNHYEMALKIRKRAVSKSARPDDVKALEVATVEELAVAETLMCMGNVYRALEDFSKAYECYLDNALIMRLDVTALLDSAFLSTSGILGLLVGDEGSIGAVDILYNRLMMTLDMARRVDLEGKESLIIGNESDSSLKDNAIKFHRSEQVADCLYDVGVISASRYLQNLDNDTSIRADQMIQRREEALSCFEEVIAIRKEVRYFEAISTGGARLAVDFHHPCGACGGFPPMEHDLRWISTTLAGLAGNFHRWSTTCGGFFPPSSSWSCFSHVVYVSSSFHFPSIYSFLTANGCTWQVGWI